MTYFYIFGPLYISGTGKVKDFKFGVQIDHQARKPKTAKVGQKGRGLRHVTYFLPECDYVTFGSLLSQFRLSSVCRLSVCLSSVVCNVGAPYSGGWTFRQNFFTAVYAGHPVTSVQNFTEIVLGEPLRRGR